MEPSSRPTIHDLDQAPLPAGYALKTRNGYTGTRGRAYTYVTASNGIVVRAANDLMEAATVVAPAELAIRGLDEEPEFIALAHGPMPEGLLKDAIQWTMEDTQTERLFSVTWSQTAGGYQVNRPDQIGSATRLEYDKQHDAVLELHSHGEAPAFFSATDNRDEQGFRLYGVVGKNRRRGVTMKAFQIRLGIYGAFRQVRMTEITAGAET